MNCNDAGLGWRKPPFLKTGRIASDALIIGDSGSYPESPAGSSFPAPEKWSHYGLCTEFRYAHGFNAFVMNGAVEHILSRTIALDKGQPIEPTIAITKD